VRIRIRVTTRAHRDELAGDRDGALLVRVRSPPVDGKANTAVCKVVARALGVAPSRVTLVHGAGSREKTLELDVADEPAARTALGLPPRP